MGRLRNILVGSASASVALLARTASAALTAARSGRGSTGQSKADRNKIPQRGSSKRAAQRREAEAAYRKQLRKEREIGVHPKYLHSYRRMWSAPARDWEKLNREWDQAHG